MDMRVLRYHQLAHKNTVPLLQHQPAAEDREGKDREKPGAGPGHRHQQDTTRPASPHRPSCQLPSPAAYPRDSPDHYWPTSPRVPGRRETPEGTRNRGRCRQRPCGSPPPTRKEQTAMRTAEIRRMAALDAAMATLQEGDEQTREVLAKTRKAAAERLMASKPLGVRLEQARKRSTRANAALAQAEAAALRAAERAEEALLEQHEASRDVELLEAKLKEQTATPLTPTVPTVVLSFADTVKKWISGPGVEPPSAVQEAVRSLEAALRAAGEIPAAEEEEDEENQDMEEEKEPTDLEAEPSPSTEPEPSPIGRSMALVTAAGGVQRTRPAQQPDEDGLPKATRPRQQ